MRSKSVLAALAFLFATALSAQVISTSQIRGTVQDASGAQVAGAQVKLTNTGTGAVRTVTTAADGSYSLPDLSVGTYELDVTKEGFNKYVQTGIVLQVGVYPTINVTLQVGAVSQEVQVSAQAAMVDTQNTGVGQVTAPQDVQDLPLNGREVTDLLYLAPGVSQGRAFRASYPSSAVPSIAGGAQGSVAYWLDGGTHNDPLSNQNLPLPFPDTIEEFKVETSSLPAQYGTHPSGAVNVVTKSGTNAFHGDAFEYVRNYIFDSKNTSYDSDGAPYVRDDLKRNQFGGTIGGPVLKDKLFFFAGWQDTIQKSTNPASTVLPTVAMVGGDFTAYAANCNPALRAFPLGAPFGTGTAADGATGPNATSPANYSPVIMALESHFPEPTNPCGIFSYQAPASFTENQGLARIDYHSSDKNSFFGRYFVTNWNQPPGSPNAPLSQGGLLISSTDGAADRVQNLTLGDTYLITSNLVNSVHVTGNRSRNLTVQNSTVDLADLFAAASVPAAQINIYQLGPPKFPKYMPGFNPTGGFFGYTASTPSIQPYDTLEFSDDISWSKGAHQLSLGTDFINLRAFATNYLNNQGAYTFDGSQTAAPAPPGVIDTVSLADFLVGETAKSGGYSQDAPIPSIQHQNVFAIYAQDAWKITPRFTLTAGLRWDPFFGHTDPKGHVVGISLQNLVDNVHSTKFPSAPAGYLFDGDPGGPSDNKLTHNALDKWSPRIGIAWDPEGNGRMSVRAGFGIFYDFPNFSYDQFGFEEPYGGAVTIPGASCASFPCTSPIANPWQTLPAFTDVKGVVHPTGTDPFPAFVGTGPQNVAYLPGALVFSYPLNIKPTYVMQYNLTVQKQVGSDWLLTATYLGNQQRHLWGNNEANPSAQGPCPPGYPLPAMFQPCVAGPCPGFLPPFACGGPGALSLNRLFAKYDAPGQGGPLYGETLLLEEGGTGNYNGLLLSVQHPFAHHFTSTTNFTWSHCISDNYTTTLGFFLAAEAVPYDRPADRGACPSADTRRVFNQSFVAQTPKFGNHLERIVLGDWQFSVSAIVQSGLVMASPINILDFSGSSNGLTQRPNLVKGADPYCQPKGRDCWLNPSAFALPAPYTFGDLPNNSLYGPGSIIVNTALARIFQIREGQQVEFRWEVFNLPNHANLYAPVNAVVAPTFGQTTPSTTAGLGALAQTVNDPRIMQFALKYSF